VKSWEKVGDTEFVDEIRGDAEGDLEAVNEREEEVEPEFVIVLDCEAEIDGDLEREGETLADFET